MLKIVPMTLALVAALAVPTASVAKAPAQPKGKMCAPVSVAAVESQFKIFNDAWATKNPDTVTALFAKDAVLLATVSNTPRTDHAGIRDYFVSFLKASPIGSIDSSTVKLGCNQAARLGTWTVSLADAQGVRTDVKARYSFIYKYENGTWKIDHLHSSKMPEVKS
jgi:uncharacterized protein (TIGR02246 family)